MLAPAHDRAAPLVGRYPEPIRAFSGSMLFVSIHIVRFGCWIGFGVESYPFGLLTSAVLS